MSIRVLRLSDACSDFTLPQIYAVNDAWFTGNPAGVLGVYDLASTLSYAGGDPTAASAVTTILGGNSAPFVVGSVVPTPVGVSYVGGGFDFSGLPAGQAYRSIEVPASISESLRATSNFLCSAWIKLPASADWNTTGSLFQMLTVGDGDAQTASKAALFGLYQLQGGILQMRAFSGNAIGRALNTTLDANYYGQVAQIGVWKIGSTIYSRIKTPLIVGAVQSGVYSGQTLSLVEKSTKIGYHFGFNNNLLSGAGTSRQVNGLRYYRFAAEDTSISGRDPVTVLDADWTGNFSKYS